MGISKSIICKSSLILLISGLCAAVPAVFAEETDGLKPAIPETPAAPTTPKVDDPAGVAAAEIVDEEMAEKKAEQIQKVKKEKKGSKKKVKEESAKAPAEAATSKQEPFHWPKAKDKPADAAVNSAVKEEKKEEKQEEAKAPAAAAADPNRPFNPVAIKEYNQGVELQQQGFLNQAIQKYKAALDADDRIERAYCNLGLIYIAQRNFGKANDAFKKALTMKPNNPFSLNGMGSVFFSKGKLAEAMERWQKAVDVDPNFFSAYFNMANAWKNEHEFDKALQNYVMTIRTNQQMADAYYEVGLIFARQKHPAQAQCMLAKALQLAPEGDFVTDAKKQLSGIESMLGKDGDEGEVQMSIVAPPSKDSSPDSGTK